MGTGIDPKVDYAFKWLFGREEMASLLINLLHAVLNLSTNDRIVEITILNPFTSKMALNDKLSVLDIRARDQRGRQFNVEMQMLGYLSVRQRLLYYWCKGYTEQLQAGQDYDQLRPTISVCFVDDVILPGTDDYHSHFRLFDENHAMTLTDDLEIHILELPKFNKAPGEIETALDGWLYFFRHGPELDPADLPGLIDRPEIRQGLEGLMELSHTGIEREIYEERMKARRDEATRQHWYRTIEARAAAAQAELAAAQARLVETQAAADAAQAGLAETRAAADAAEERARRGEFVGRITAFQQALGQEPTPRDQLQSTSLHDLARMEEELFHRLAPR